MSFVMIYKNLAPLKNCEQFVYHVIQNHETIIL